MGVLKIGGKFDFLEESLWAEHSGKLGVQYLDRDLAIVLLVVREVNGGHATSAQFALDGVSGERTLNQFNAFSHSGRRVSELIEAHHHFTMKGTDGCD
jgi:hypothetical protein